MSRKTKHVCDACGAETELEDRGPTMLTPLPLGALSHWGSLHVMGDLDLSRLGADPGGSFDLCPACLKRVMELLQLRRTDGRRGSPHLASVPLSATPMTPLTAKTMRDLGFSEQEIRDAGIVDDTPSLSALDALRVALYHEVVADPSMTRDHLIDKFRERMRDPDFAPAFLRNASEIGFLGTTEEFIAAEADLILSNARPSRGDA